MFAVAAATTGRDALMRTGPVLPVVVVGTRGSSRTWALVDTGSQSTVVDRRILREVCSRPAGEVMVRTILDTDPATVYSADIHTDGGFVLTEGLPGVLGADLEPPVQVLIGRDVLSRMRLVYDGQVGTWQLASYGRDSRSLPMWFWVGTGLILGAGVGLIIASSRQRGPNDHMTVTV